MLYFLLLGESQNKSTLLDNVHRYKWNRERPSLRPHNTPTGSYLAL